MASSRCPSRKLNLPCCGSDGERILVGGMPHGTAFSLNAGGNWQASWMDGVETGVLCIALDLQVTENWSPVSRQRRWWDSALTQPWAQLDRL